MSLEDRDKQYAESGYTKEDFDQYGLHGVIYKKYSPYKDSYEYEFYPTVFDESAGLRLPIEVSSEALDELGEEQLKKNLAFNFILDLVDIASNVSKRMVNKDLFNPIIPAEAYADAKVGE